MELSRNSRSGILHRPGCPHTKGEHGIRTAVPWRYASSIRDEAALARETVKYPNLHLCRECLPGICKCKDCEGT